VNDDMAEFLEFLRARLGEDEQAARAAVEDAGAEWYYDGGGYVLARHEDNLVATGSHDFLERERGVHIARHDPARVLREADAKRRILDEIIPRMNDMDDQIHAEFGVGPMDPSTYETLGLLRLLALPYADHPDYRAEWRAGEDTT
jgi:hypothetical protein